jgi:hypothetical protein
MTEASGNHNVQSSMQIDKSCAKPKYESKIKSFHIL